MFGDRSQAHGIKGQATQSQESPPQHPQGPSLAGGRTFRPPGANCRTLSPTPSPGTQEGTGESEEYAQSTPLTLGVVQEVFKTGPRRMYSSTNLVGKL